LAHLQFTKPIEEGPPGGQSEPEVKPKGSIMALPQNQIRRSDMGVQDIIQSIAEKTQSSAHVKTVYGESVVTNGKTVVPVARVAYGFGGGAGSRAKTGSEHDGKDEGGGGGGGCAVIPVGVVEITGDSTRYIAFGLAPKLTAGVVGGLLVGYLLGKWRRKA
jgi:uncharacterized spore protein YtfJ